MNWLKININESYLNQFERIAKDLFSNYELVVDKTVYQFAEIEFYYKTIDEDKHHDTFVHADPMQKEPGQWYFHGSGIDITIGDGTNYGGILIRGLKKGEEFISGPLNVAKEIFSQLGGVMLQKIELGIRKQDKTSILDTSDFVASTRVGLPKSKSELAYFNANYRFITSINPKHPFKEKTKVAQYLKQQMGETWNDKVMKEKFGYKII